LHFSKKNEILVASASGSAINFFFDCCVNITAVINFHGLETAVWLKDPESGFLS
jgi:hypothetical protein